MRGYVFMHGEKGLSMLDVSGRRLLEVFIIAIGSQVESNEENWPLRGTSYFGEPPPPDFA